MTENDSGWYIWLIYSQLLGNLIRSFQVTDSWEGDVAWELKVTEWLSMTKENIRDRKRGGRMLVRQNQIDRQEESTLCCPIKFPSTVRRTMKWRQNSTIMVSH